MRESEGSFQLNLEQNCVQVQHICRNLGWCAGPVKTRHLTATPTYQIRNLHFRYFILKLRIYVPKLFERLISICATHTWFSCWFLRKPSWSNVASMPNPHLCRREKAAHTHTHQWFTMTVLDIALPKGFNLKTNFYSSKMGDFIQHWGRI